VSDPPIHERRFTDREVRAILKKAADESPGRSLMRPDGLTLAELKSIGAEVGLDAARLEEAARAVVEGRTNRPNRLLGGPTLVHFERRAEGEISEEETPEVLSVIRRNVGRQGKMSDAHGLLEWSDRSDSGERYITLSSRDGVTTVTGSSNLTNMAVLTYLPVGVMGLFTSLIGLIKYVKDGSELGLVLFIVVLPVLYMILRTILGHLTRSESLKMERAVDELTRLVETSNE
jgi:hypothetical protein